MGKTLLKALIAESERHRLWTLQASIFPENFATASIALHKSCGFRKVGIRRHIAKFRRDLERHAFAGTPKFASGGLEPVAEGAPGLVQAGQPQARSLQDSYFAGIQ